MKPKMKSQGKNNIKFKNGNLSNPFFPKYKHGKNNKKRQMLVNTEFTPEVTSCIEEKD